MTYFYETKANYLCLFNEYMGFSDLVFSQKMIPYVCFIDERWWKIGIVSENDKGDAVKIKISKNNKTYLIILYQIKKYTVDQNIRAEEIVVDERNYTNIIDSQHNLISGKPGCEILEGRLGMKNIQYAT